MKKKGLVRGVGINDADYKVTKCKMVDGKWKIIWRCLCYDRWDSVLARGHCEKFKISNPTYKDCSVCKEWRLFSNFKKWMETQDWKGKELDKDLLFPGNKVYSPETCVFIDRRVNGFLTDNTKTRGDCLIGVSLTRYGKFRATCRDPFKINSTFLGTFDTEEGAHQAWKERKHKYALLLAELETDPRIIEALQTYVPKKYGEIKL